MLKKPESRKTLTLLHSNDMHGDFLPEKLDDRLIGGVSRLSGYIRRVRAQEKSVLYAIAGDMFRGSVIDSEYRGISTIEIMNMLTPDVVTVGNHEVDYGIGHLLFLEKCARFPIINANLYLTTNQIRLFRSHYIAEIGGLRVMFIGVLTEEVLAQARQEHLIGAFVDVKEAAAEIGKICNAHRTEDVDLTVLLTHIGFEEDCRLASLLDPDWHIDLIIGGHSHTHLTKPHVVAGIPIVQAACGTDQIGRFDLEFDENGLIPESIRWTIVPIDDSHCPRDCALEEVLDRYKLETEAKYDRYITRFADTYTHPSRNEETQLGKLFADVLRDSLGLDIMLLASGSLRQPQLGPLVDRRALTQMFPFHDPIHRISVTGAQLKNMLAYLYRPEDSIQGRREHYQLSSGLHVTISASRGTLLSAEYHGAPIDDNAYFRVGLQGFHYQNMEAFFGITEDEVSRNAPTRIVATDCMDVLEENLSRKELVTCPTDTRYNIVS